MTAIIIRTIYDSISGSTFPVSAYQLQHKAAHDAKSQTPILYNDPQFIIPHISKPAEMIPSAIISTGPF